MNAVDRKKPAILLIWLASYCIVCALTVKAASNDYSLPAGVNAVNAKSHGAKGDGTTDDTKAIKDAVAKCPSWGHVYLPAGTYLVSDQIFWRQFVTFQGAGPEKTIIKLKDNCAGFGDGSKPKAVVRCYYSNNASHSNHILNLAIDVGSGNKGASGISLSAHNGGGIENVVVRSTDGSGAMGLDITTAEPGPSLINHVTVKGFDIGIAISHGTYSSTFEHITLENQNVVGFQNNYHPVSLRRLISKNKVPAVRNPGTHPYGQLVMLDCEFTGGSPDVAAIESEGYLYARNVKTTGYKAALKNKGSIVAGATIDEFSSMEFKTTHASTPKRSLMLPIEETPVVEWGDTSEWVNVNSYENVMLDEGGDWGAAIQKAIDDGAKYLYFPAGSQYPYETDTPVHLRGNIRRIMGFSARITSPEVGGPLFIFDNPDSKAVVVIEQVRTRTTDHDFYHNSAMTGVIKRCTMHGGFRNGPGAKNGKLFLEDILGEKMRFSDGLRVWIRDLDCESQIQNVYNNGAIMWMLGYKTEFLETILHNENGALSEVFGGNVCPSQGSPTKPMHINDNSAIALFHQVEFGGYPTFMKETRDGNTQSFKQPSDPVFYVSNAEAIDGRTMVSNKKAIPQVDKRVDRAAADIINVSGSRQYLNVSTDGQHVVKLYSVSGKLLARFSGNGAARYPLVSLSKQIVCISVQTAGSTYRQLLNKQF